MEDEQFLVVETYRQIAVGGIAACQTLADSVRQVLLVVLGRLGRQTDGLFLELHRHVDSVELRSPASGVGMRGIRLEDLINGYPPRQSTRSAMCLYSRV